MDLNSSLCVVEVIMCMLLTLMQHLSLSSSTCDGRRIYFCAKGYRAKSSLEYCLLVIRPGLLSQQAGRNSSAVKRAFKHMVTELPQRYEAFPLR